MEQFTAALNHTPTWVWVVFVLLVIHGLRARKHQVTHISRVAVAPVVFTLLSIHTVVSAFHPGPVTLGILVGAIGLGAALGFGFFKTVDIAVDQKKKLYKFPGSFRNVVIILILFCARYFVSFQTLLDPNLEKQTALELLLLAVLGLGSGFFIGKFSYCLTLMKSGPHTDLEIPKRRQKA